MSSAAGPRSQGRSRQWLVVAEVVAVVAEVVVAAADT